MTPFFEDERYFVALIRLYDQAAKLFWICR
jgi:hypothetical protein